MWCLLFTYYFLLVVCTRGGIPPTWWSAMGYLALGVDIPLQSMLPYMGHWKNELHENFVSQHNDIIRGVYPSMQTNLFLASWKPSGFHLASWIWPIGPSDLHLAIWLSDHLDDGPFKSFPWNLDVFLIDLGYFFLTLDPKHKKKPPKLQGHVISGKKGPCQEAWDTVTRACMHHHDYLAIWPSGYLAILVLVLAIWPSGHLAHMGQMVSNCPVWLSAMQ